MSNAVEGKLFRGEKYRTLLKNISNRQVRVRITDEKQMRAYMHLYMCSEVIVANGWMQFEIVDLSEFVLILFGQTCDVGMSGQGHWRDIAKGHGRPDHSHDENENKTD